MYFLETGPDVSTKDEQGRTPLDFARLLQEKKAGADIAEIVKSLEEAGG